MATLLFGMSLVRKPERGSSKWTLMANGGWQGFANGGWQGFVGSVGACVLPLMDGKWQRHFKKKGHQKIFSCISGTMYRICQDILGRERDKVK